MQAWWAEEISFKNIKNLIVQKLLTGSVNNKILIKTLWIPWMQPIMPLTMELVEPPEVIEQRLQRLGHRQQLQEAMDDDVEHREEAQTHVPEVDGQVL